MPFNVKKLIENVEYRPPLWDTTNKDYNNRVLVKQLWEEVGDELKEPCDVVKAKWRNLRDNFRRQLIKLDSANTKEEASSIKSKWVHFGPLSFLQKGFGIQKLEETGQIKIKENNDSDVNDSHSGTSEQRSDEEASEKEEDVKEIRRPPRKKIMTTSLHQMHHNKINRGILTKRFSGIRTKPETHAMGAIDSDYHFLMSLLPIMQKLPSLKNMQMRLNIQQLFVNEEMIAEYACDKHPEDPEDEY